MSQPVLEALDLWRRYPARASGRGQTRWVVEGVSLKLPRGSSMGLVGESGAGKSTLARLLLALETPDRGTVVFDGERISGVPERRLRRLRRRFQPVFQDPGSSLNAHLDVSTIVAEPLVAHRLGTPRERRGRVEEVLGLVGLPTSVAGRRPDQLSGGQRQRVAIARALATAPDLLILDEPTSALDALAQARILDLLVGLRSRLGLTLLLVSHDLDVVSAVCDQVAVMLAGRIVERGPTARILKHPGHAHTQALVSCRPRLGGGLFETEALRSET